MHRLIKRFITVSLAAVILASAANAQDKAAVVQRLRGELATLLKKDAAKLPADKPVAGLGADELTVIEWQMAAEKAFRVNISDDKLFEKKSPLTTRKDLTIDAMAAIVAAAPKWPAGKTK
jgi:acyl carrier protein